MRVGIAGRGDGLTVKAAEVCLECFDSGSFTYFLCDAGKSVDPNFHTFH